MAQPHTPQRGHRAQAAPTEVSYSAYSPSPSSLDAFRHRSHRIEQWTNQVPKSPGASVGAKSAVWSDDLSTVSEEGSGHASARPREYLQPPSENGHSRPQPRHSPVPSLRRQPPVPLLAQTPQSYPQPELSRGEHLSRSPSFHSPASARSARYARDAYLNQALELPLDMLTEVDAPNEVYDHDPSPKPGRVGAILSRARSTVSLKGAAAGSTPHPAAAPPLSTHAHPQVMSHSQSKAYTRRHSQQSLRSVPEMHILPKLVVNARAPHTGLGSEVRPVTAQSPAPSYEDSKCSSMQTSESGHSFVKADLVPLSQPNAYPTYPAYPAELSVTPNPAGVTNKGASIQPVPTSASSPLNQDPIPTAQLARRTTSRGHHQVPSPAISAGAGGPVEQLASSAGIRPRHPSLRTGQRPVLTKSASVDGQMSNTIRSAYRAPQRAPSSASERTASDHGVVFHPSTVGVDNIRDNGERIAFEVPNRRGKLHVSLAWLPGRVRGAQSQPASRPATARAYGANAADRRASLQVPPHARQAPTHRRSLSASEAPNRTPYPAPAPAPHGVPPAGVPASHYMPGAVPLQEPGYSLPAAGQMPQHMPGVRATNQQMPPGAPQAGLPQVAPGSYPMQPSYSYPSMQMPMQAGPGMPMAPWPAHIGMAPAPRGHPAPAQRANVGRGGAPGREQMPSRAATFPAPSAGSPWRKLWPFGKHGHNDTFLSRPPAAPKTARFAEPLVTGHKAQKDMDRQRRAQRRDERAKRKSATKAQGESGKKTI